MTPKERTSLSRDRPHPRTRFDGECRQRHVVIHLLSSVSGEFYTRRVFAIRLMRSLCPRHVAVPTSYFAVLVSRCSLTAASGMVVRFTRVGQRRMPIFGATR